jgi:hypothetical protein
MLKLPAVCRRALHPMAGLGRAILIAMAILARPIAAAAQSVHITLRQATPGIYLLNGEFTVRASSSAAWEVITDYDAIGRFVSSIRSSRVLKRGPGSAIIEQEGNCRFLFFSRRVKLTLAVKESPPGRVYFREISGPQFKRYQGSWTITDSIALPPGGLRASNKAMGSKAGCSVSYELVVAPNFSVVPRFITKSVLKKSAQQLLNEVRTEIERRTRELPNGGVGALPRISRVGCGRALEIVS